jgi:hypothetical protein
VCVYQITRCHFFVNTVRTSDATLLSCPPLWYTGILQKYSVFKFKDDINYGTTTSQSHWVQSTPSTVSLSKTRNNVVSPSNLTPPFCSQSTFICLYIFPSRSTRHKLITLNHFYIIRNLKNYLPRLITLLIEALSCLVWYGLVSGLELGLSARDAWSLSIARTTCSCKLPFPQPSSKVKPHKFWRTKFKTYLKTIGFLKIVKVSILNCNRRCNSE